MAVAHVVQGGEERAVGLPVRAGQFDALEPVVVEDAADRVGLEEPGAVPFAPVEPFPVLLGDDGRQLGQVADHDEPDAAERLAAAARPLEEPVEAVGQVGAQHADLVDDERVEDPVQRVARASSAFGGCAFGGDVGAGVDELVDGHAARVQRGDACGCAGESASAAVARADPMVDERALARACAAGEEHVRGPVERVERRGFEVLVGEFPWFGHVPSHASGA